MKLSGRPLLSTIAWIFVERPATTDADRLIFLPPFPPPRRGMGFHDRVVNQIEPVARLRSQRVEYPLPAAAPGSPVKAAIGRRIRAVAFGQIPPRHPSRLRSSSLTASMA